MLELEKNCQVEGKHRGEKRLSGAIRKLWLF
jgi:hypothetical protein